MTLLHHHHLLNFHVIFNSAPSNAIKIQHHLYYINFNTYVITFGKSTDIRTYVIRLYFL